MFSYIFYTVHAFRTMSDKGHWCKFFYAPKYAILPVYAGQDGGYRNALFVCPVCV